MRLRGLENGMRKSINESDHGWIDGLTKNMW